MTDTIAALIDDVLALEDDYELVQQLAALDPRYAMTVPADQPEPLRWFASIAFMQCMVDGQGISHYLSLDNDLDFSLALESCRRIGAARTVAYLEAAAALYPGSDLVPHAEFEAARQRHWAIRNPILDRVRSLPPQVVSNGKKLGLLSGANDVVIAVSLCLALHDWMMIAPEGVKAARLLYGLFDGLAPCPEVPAKSGRARPNRS